MTPTFDERTRALESALREDAAAAGLLLLGSAAVPRRRDEWSDHDFYAIARPDGGAQIRDVRSWLPAPHEIVAVAREGEIGFAVLYGDGHVFEFAAATTAELAGAVVGDDHEVVFDDDGGVQDLVRAARERSAQPDRVSSTPANDVALVLIKLLIGVGRARRGEAISAGLMVRAWALGHVVRAVRERVPSETATTETLDPTRRFETAYPRIGANIAEALALPVEEAAHALYRLMRAELEPGWDQFPSQAADAVARRLGWALGEG